MDAKGAKITGKVSPIGKVTGRVRTMEVPTSHYYDGTYDVTPRAEMQKLETAQKMMRSDVVVEEIPYTEVTNTSGGLTVIIA